MKHHIRKSGKRRSDCICVHVAIRKVSKTRYTYLVLCSLYGMFAVGVWGLYRGRHPKHCA